MSRTGARARRLVAPLALLAAAALPASGAHAQARWPSPVDDDQVFGRVIVEQLERRWSHDAPGTFGWEAQGWLGTDRNKAWFKTEGDRRVSGGGAGELELQLLYSRLATAFWDLQLGVRYDRLFGAGPDSSRFHAVVGLQGTAPYGLEVEPALFLGNRGDLAARLTATRDLRLTQRAVLQSRVELNAAAQEVSSFDVGRGLNDVRLGLRLRYEVERKVAPYVGLSWVRRLGATARLFRAAGEPLDELTVQAGVRLAF